MPDERNIRLSIDLDVKDAEQSAKELQQAVEDIFESRKDDTSASLTNLEIQMKKSYDQSVKLREALEGISDAKVSTQQYVDLQTQIEQAEQSASQLNEKISQVREYAAQHIQIFDEDVGQTLTLKSIEETIRNLQRLKDYYTEIGSTEDLTRTEANLAHYEELQAQAHSMSLERIQGTIENIQKLKAHYEEIGSMDDVARMEANLAHYQELQAEYLNQDINFDGATVSIADLETEYQNLIETITTLKAQQNELRVEEESANEEYLFQLREEEQTTQQQLDITNDKLKQLIIRYYELADAQAAAGQRGEMQQARSQAAAQRQAEAQAMRKSRQEMTNLNRSTRAFSRTVRGFRDVLPSMLTTAVTRLQSIEYGINTLTYMIENGLVNALESVKGLVQKIINIIKSHPIIAIIGAIIAILTLLIKLGKKIGTWLKEKVEAELEAIRESLKQIWGYLAPILSAVGDFVTTTLTSAISGFVKLGTLLGRTLVRGIMAIIDKLKQMKSLLQENIKLMAKWNKGANDVNKAMSNLTSSLAYLKASITAALVPILTAIEPLLTFVLDHIADAINLIGIFIAKITGATHYQQVIRKQKDYAKSLNGVGDAAEDAANKLASFDKLNVIGDKNQSASTVDFQLIDIKNTALPNWFDNLEELGRKVAKTITKILKNIPWKNIQKTATDAARAVADFINGLNIDKGSLGIGITIGEGLNTVTKTINAFLDELDGEKLGNRIGQELRQMINAINFKELGNIFSGSLNELADIIKGFSDQFDGSDLAIKISDFLETGLGGIQWNEKVIPAMEGMVDDFVKLLNGVITPENLILIATTLKNALVTVITGIKLFADRAEWQEWGESLAKGIMAFFEDPEIFKDTAIAIGNLATGILDMLLAAMNKLLEGDNLEKIKTSIVTFFENIPWEELALKAVEISRSIREGLQEVWKELKTSGAYQDFIRTIVDFINEVDQWKDLINGIKTDVVADVFKVKNENIITKIMSGIVGFIQWLLNNTGIGQIMKPILDKMAENVEEATGSTKYTYISPVMKKQMAVELGKDVKIPGYASGTVIPPNMSAHLAVLGDNNTETEVVSPLSTIEQALRNVMSEQNINVTFQVEGDPDNIFRVVQREAKSYNKRTHNLAFGGA